MRRSMRQTLLSLLLVGCFGSTGCPWKKFNDLEDDTPVVVYSKNKKAYDRMKIDYNFLGTPTVWFDGGDIVELGRVIYMLEQVCFYLIYQFGRRCGRVFQQR